MVLEQFIIDADIIWDQVGKTFFENPEAKPGRIMRVQVVNAGIIENLTGYTLNLGWTSVRDPSKFGLDAFDDVDITKGIFEIEYTSGMLTNVGPLNASLQLVPPGQGRPIESNNFKLTVKNSAINPEAIQGETSFSTLENALVEVNGWNARIDVVEADFIQRANDMEATYPQELLLLGSQLADIEADYQAAAANLTIDSEVILSRDGEISLDGRLNTIESGERLDIIYKGTNLFNVKKRIEGFYVYHLSGAFVARDNYWISDYILVNPDEDIKISSYNQLAFYDASKVYISGAVGSGTGIYGNEATVHSPVGAKYLVICGQFTNTVPVQVEYGTISTLYEPFKRHLRYDYIDTDYANKIIVKPDGTGHFTNPVDAILSITDSAKNNPYDILIYPGTYDIMSLITIPATPNLTWDETSQSYPNRGLELPDYVNLIGVGDKEDIVLKGELSGTATAEQIKCLSTINLMQNNKLENLTITAKNLRYAVHHESGGRLKDWFGKMKNVVVKHFGNDFAYAESKNAWGEGCSSGSEIQFEDCEFYTYTDTGVPCYVHNNTAFDKPSKHRFDNCKFINVNATNKFTDSVYINSVGSGVKDKVIFNGCEFTSAVRTREEIVGVGNDFEITGYGNTKVRYKRANDLDRQVAFTDEVVAICNTGTLINRFDVVDIENKKMTTSDNNLFKGVAIEDIAQLGVGHIRVDGYISKTDSGITDVIAKGTLIGIVNNRLAIVASNPIAIGVDDTFIKFL